MIPKYAMLVLLLCGGHLSRRMMDSPNGKAQEEHKGTSLDGMYRRQPSCESPRQLAGGCQFPLRPVVDNKSPLYSITALLLPGRNHCH
mmetsp:Transcript_18546/g.33612  ORF Transcript_18546/g.33612 Transcript_18546/m.33612 type:complete len:88 (-) Transcript_18546:1236-1499(-)